jgi:two-component system response regulator AlgR
MKCLVVDDELLARERLKRQLQELEGCEVCGEAVSGEDAVRKAESLRPEVVLLDIRMPGMDGMEAARRIYSLPRPPAVIFTTAYGDHALEAFEAQAIDYLLKPINPERLRQALERSARFGRGEPAPRDPTSQPRTQLSIRTRGGVEMLPVDEVLYFQADNKYVTVRTCNRRLLLEESLKSLAEEFATEFLRVHRNALVAVHAVRGLERDAHGQHRVIFSAVEERLEVSRRLLPELRRRLKDEG